MHDSRTFPLAAIACALALAGCSTGSGDVAVQDLPPADNTLPGEVPTGTTDGIEDYLGSGGTWRINLDGQVATTAFGTAVMADALVYDAGRDRWIINVSQTNLQLDNVGAGVYATPPGCDPKCAQMQIYDDDPTASQYGTFAYVLYFTPTTLVEYFTYYGLKTQVADMPAGGTGTYAGTFLGLVNSDVGFDYIEGSADVTANFGTGLVTFDSVDTGLDPNYSYSLTGTAQITGNTYSGTVSGSYTTGLGTATFDAAGSSLSGAFYGPSQTDLTGETAGAVYTSGPQGELAGGFWAGQTGYAP